MTEMVSIITKASAENLGLEEDKEVCPFIKAPNAISALD
jgi:molybdopterin-binding protein